MKKEYLLALTAFFMLSFTTVAITYAGEEAAPASIIIKTYNKDVNGDGKKEKILLKGMPYQQGHSYFQKIWSEIVIPKHPLVTLPYKAGMAPKLEFADINHDKVKDIISSSATGGSAGLYHYRINSLKDNQITNIPLPAPLNLQGQFENSYKAFINIGDTKEIIRLDLAKRKKDYIRLGLFQDNGKLNEPTELIIAPVAQYKTVKIKGKKGYGLKSYRQISGAYHADLIGVLEATWYYDNGKWNLVKTQWNER
ncbi:hypothetical protein [Bacillus sp. FJAT-49736]|uniref:hypothetical protein n=1 Tax=Bacillus sp. FJAT-49736 TaxID=2833582 RepID=UPI001BC95C4D|nr:hypothetical protein [Bacillus sp. FJAT-49736]MBS4173015.1 hypothetical protein [Bacillus sp. FJAT-49736]